MTQRRMSLAQREEIEGYVFLLPWSLGFLIFSLGPLLASMYLGMTNYRGAGTPEWIGFGNFERMLFNDKLFWQSLKVTLVYAAGYLPLGLVFGFSIALLMNQKVRGILTFRTIYYLPAVVSGAAVAILWQFVFHRDFGVLNEIIGWFGAEPIPWLLSERYAMVAFIIMGLWGVGGGMIIYLAGLQGIPTDLYEAAAIDGANVWQRFWKVTIPMMTPTIFFNLVTGLIGTLQIFATAYIMTSGGPNYATYFYSLNVYYTTFQKLQIGYAAALAWVLFIIILVVTLIVFSTSNRWVYYEHEAERRPV
jgi:multiple sugar transport system permease protein